MIRAVATEELEREGEKEEYPEESEEEDRRRPVEDREREYDTESYGPLHGLAEQPELARPDELVDHALPLCDGEELHPDGEDDERKEHLRDLVVERPRDASSEEHPRRQREDEHGDEAAEAAAETLADVVHRDRTQHRDHRGGKQRRRDDRLLGGRSESDDQRDRRDRLIEDGAELSGTCADVEPGPRVERHGGGEVLDDVVRRSVVVVRVVPVVEGFPVRTDMVRVVAHPDPQHERHEGCEDGDVIQTIDSIDLRLVLRESLFERVEPLAHCPNTLPKRA